MEQHKDDIIRSVIAIGLCIVFLWTGKTFIWNQAVEPDTIPASETDPNFTEIVPDLTDTPDFPEITQADTPDQPDATAPVSDYDFPESTTSFTALSFPSEQTALTSSTALSQNSTAVSSTSTVQTSSSAVSQKTSSTSSSSSTTTTSQTTTAQTSSTTTSAVTTTTKAAANPGGFGAAPAGYFNDALFIGDSRMVGVVSYSKFDSASYFATVGLSTYNLDKSKSEITENKGQSFSQILSSKKFGKVYIHMGINEIASDLNKTISNYKNLIQRIQSASPGCLIYLNANLRVTAAKSKSDKNINNTKINKLNDALKAMCNGNDIVYLDVNPLFDDGSGALAKQYTGDGIHPKATYYKQWAEWLKNNVKL